MARREGESESSSRINAIRTSSDETLSNRRSNKLHPCSWWTTFCRYLLNKQNEFWGKVGHFVATRPILVIVICVVACGAFSGGFALMKVETRTEKLFIPQDSRSITDLKMANQYFTLSTRQVNILLKPTSGQDVLNEKCFQDALKLHNTIKNISGFSSLCIKSIDPNRSFPCLILSPLELFDYQSNFSSIKSRLTFIHNDTSYVMSNGRQAILNFPLMFGQLKTDPITHVIKSAKAIHMTYYLEEKENDEVLKWEKEFSQQMIELKGTLNNVEVFFSAESSLDDAIAESTSGDIMLISITFTVMITFACFMLAKFRNPLTGHSNLAMAGVLCVGLGILSAFGLCMYIGIPFISLVGVLPFLILGIGTDDMFIIVDELDRVEPLDPPRRLQKTMSHIGASITMTTVTDLVAFAVSTLSAFPAITHFCVYAAMSITFVFLYQVTLFLSFANYDLKRIVKGYRDMPICMKAPPPPAGVESWDRPLPQTSNKVMKIWAKFLMLWPVRITVLVISLGLLAGGIYGAFNITEEFDRRMLAKDGSEFTLYLNNFEENFPQTLEVNIILDDKDIDYSDMKIQKEIEKLDEIARNNQYYENRSVSWMSYYKHWATMYNQSTTGKAFIPTLQYFLFQKGYSSFKTDIVFNKNQTKVKASRLLVYYKSTASSITQRDAMLSLRQDLDDQTTLPAYAIARPFIFFEQYAITSKETIRNLIIASLTILIITAPTLTSPLVIFLVFYGFVSLILELLGLMYIWDVSLNSISMINLVMAIGFAVDYSAHVAHAFVVSTEASTEERIIEALSTVGASVLMGGLSTFLGMLLTAFASSEVFRIFFRMFFGIVLMGLLHGLCFLPVLLSLFNCRRPRVNTNEKEKKELGIINCIVSASEPTIDQIPRGNSWEMKPTANGVHHDEVEQQDGQTDEDNHVDHKKAEVQLSTTCQTDGDHSFENGTLVPNGSTSSNSSSNTPLPDVETVVPQLLSDSESCEKLNTHF